MALNFPDNPSVGDTYNDTISGFIYRWDGTVWESLYDTIAAVDANISVDTTPQLGGDLDLNSNDITGTGNINITGIVTATSFSGSGASLTNIPNESLDNSTVSYGGIQLSLGGSDATPAFDLQDATNYPYSSLTGITTDIIGDTTPQLGGDLDLNSSNITGTGNINITGTATFSGDVSIGGTLTYEDVTNVDSVGLITARSGVRVTTGGIEVSAGGLSVTGVITASNGVTGNLTGNADTATTLATSRTLSVSGDGTGSASFDGSGDADIALTLANSGVTAATYGSSSAIPSITVDAKGRITSATTNSIDSTSISNGTASVSVASNGPITSNANHDFSSGIDVTGNITVTGTVDGRDVATDGSKLDGIESNATADQTASEILTAIKTVDGSGSGLDADLLDGQQGSYYLNTSTSFGGDVSGTYNSIVVTDDSHNHIISNVDGLQTALDGKLSTTGKAADSNLLDGIDSGSFLRSDASDTATGTLTVRDIKLSAGYHLQRSNHHSGHLEGSYNNIGANSYKTNPIYSIGSSYNPNDDTLNNFYGIGYSHTNASFINFTGASGWGMYVAADGDARIYLSASNGVISSTGDHYVGSSKVWHAGNDGSGSGLDADTLDGVQGSSYLRSDTSDTFTGTLTVSGNVSISDKIIHTGDTNTAIRFPAADTITAETSGTERLRIGSAGQIGLGGANYGTSGQVITSNGSGSAPTWQDAGGGAWNLLATVNASGASTVDFTSNFSSTYKMYMVQATNLYTNSTSNLMCQFYNNGTLDSTSNYDFINQIWYIKTDNSFSSILQRQSNLNGIYLSYSLGVTTSSTEGSSLNLWIPNPYTSYTRFSVMFDYWESRNASNISAGRILGAGTLDKSVTNISGIRFLQTSGSATTSGTFKLYGIS